MRRLINGEYDTSAERKALCQWLLESKAEGDLVDPDYWHLQKVECQRDQTTLEFLHGVGHELTMHVQVINGISLIESASYSLTIMNRSFDMDTGERIVRNTFTGTSVLKSDQVKRKDGSLRVYESADPDWGAW